MYKLCKTEQSANRQKQLEQGLLQMMKQRRYEDISVSDLCDFMEIPRKSFYRYFSSKDGALYALLDHTMMAFYEGGYHRAGITNQIGDLDQFFIFWYEHRELLEVLQRSSLSGLLVERATLLVQRERLIPGQLLLLPANRQSIAMSFAICGLLSMVIQWHQQGYVIEPAEMTQLAKTMLTQPLIAIP